MEDFDILNKFDNDKLIDIVKNYKRYGYNVSDCSTTSCVFDFLLRCTPL